MKPVILVIDDEEAIRLFLDATLRDEGYDVLLAGNGQEAIDLLGRTVPDLVLLDLMLPDMSGIEVLKKVREMLPHLAVVMITAYSETDSAVQAMKLDAFDYVSKPIQLDKLLKVIAKGLEETTALEKRDLFLGALNSGREAEAGYVKTIQSLGDNALSFGTGWLQTVVDRIIQEALDIMPSCK